MTDAASSAPMHQPIDEAAESPPIQYQAKVHIGLDTTGKVTMHIVDGQGATIDPSADLTAADTILRLMSCALMAVGEYAKLPKRTGEDFTPMVALIDSTGRVRVNESIDSPRIDRMASLDKLCEAFDAAYGTLMDEAEKAMLDALPDGTKH